jgi:putative addiction module killer protein
MRGGNRLVILLIGGDKSSQQKDIEKAKQIAQELKR